MSQYCQAADLTLYALPGTALPPTITPQEITAACVAASAMADSKMRARFPLPIAGSQAGGAGVYDPVIVMHVACEAAWLLMKVRGFATEDGSDSRLWDGHVAAFGDPKVPESVASSYFGRVERGSEHPDVLVNLPAPPTYRLPQVRSKPPRGI